MPKNVIFNNKIFESIEIEKIPKKISDEIDNNTFIFNNIDIFPSGNSINTKIKLLSDEYNQLKKKIEKNYSDEVDANSIKDVSTRLNNLITTCQSIENSIISELEKKCAEFIINNFNIPEETIEISCKISNEINNKKNFLESQIDFELEDSDTLDWIDDEINKRLLLMTLSEGIANIYSSNVSLYVNEIYQMSARLPLLYEQIALYNNFLLYSSTYSESEKYNGGNVNVYIFSPDKQPKIESNGIILPVLINETLKGVLELISSKFLPSEKEITQYILGKSEEYCNNEWCVRFGIPIWKKIEEIANEFGYDEKLLFPLYNEISGMDYSLLSKLIKEVIIGTKKSRKMIGNILYSINKKLEMDDFKKYYNDKNKGYDFDDEYITNKNADKLLQQ